MLVRRSCCRCGATWLTNARVLLVVFVSVLFLDIITTHNNVLNSFFYSGKFIGLCEDFGDYLVTCRYSVIKRDLPIEISPNSE